MRPRIAAIQMTSGVNVNENLAIAEKLIIQSAQAEAHLTILPEMFATMAMDPDLKIKQREAAG